MKDNERKENNYRALLEDGNRTRFSGEYGMRITGSLWEQIVSQELAGE